MTENIDTKNFDDRLKSNIQKMVCSYNMYIKEAKNMEQLEDNLKHMEETDENFHE